MLFRSRYHQIYLLSLITDFVAFAIIVVNCKTHQKQRREILGALIRDRAVEKAATFFKTRDNIVELKEHVMQVSQSCIQEQLMPPAELHRTANEPVTVQSELRKLWWETTGVSPTSPLAHGLEGMIAHTSWPSPMRVH